MAIIDNLVAYYSLEDNAANSTVADAHDVGPYDGAVVNDQNNYSSEQSATGKISSGFDLDGTNDRVDITGPNLSMPVCLQAWGQPDVNNVEQVLVYLGDGVVEGGGADHFALGITAGGKAFARAQRGSAYIDAVGSTTLLTDGTWYHLVAVFASGTNRQIFVNGSSEDTETSDETPVSGKTVWSIGAFSTGAAPFNGVIDEVGVWNRDISSDISALYNSGAGLGYPFTGGDKDVPVSAQTLTLAAPAPTIVISDVETPSAQALTLTGPAPTPSVSALPSAEALTLAGPAPTIRIDATPTPAAQALTLAVPAPTIKIDATVAPSAQALTLAAPAPTVEIGATPAAQAITVAAPAPTVTIDATVAPSAQALTLAAPAPTVDTSGSVTVQPSALPLTLSSPAPAVTIDATVAPSAQTLTLAAPAPTVDVSGSVTVQPSALALTLTAPAPTVTIDATVTPTALAMTLASPAPAPAVTFLPAAQAVTLAAPAPSVRLDSTFSAAAQSLTLGAPAPTISTGMAMAAAAFLLINRSRK